MAALIEFEGAQMVQQLRASGPVENGPQEPVRGRASVSAVLSQLASCKTLASAFVRVKERPTHRTFESKLTTNCVLRLRPAP